MEKFISKIRNGRLKGNISLLVIFVLLASSVIALLSINQIQRLLTYGNMTFNYFRAFYLAKAGTELGLTEVYHREAGFEQIINSGSSIVTENLVGNYTGFNPYFTMNISGNFLYLTDDVRYTDKCDNDNRITLGAGEGIVLSLFKDNTSEIKKILTGTEEANIAKFENNLISRLKIKEENRRQGNGTSKYFTFGLFDYNDRGDMGDIFVQTGGASDLSNFLLKINESSIKYSTRRYLTIKNSGINDETVSFCITIDNVNSNNLIPYSDSLITVRGNYGDMEVGLQSVVKRQSPGWSLNVLGNVGS